MLINLGIQIVISLVIIYYLTHDYIKGISLSVFFLITLPNSLSVNIGSLFELHMYRIILIILIVFCRTRSELYTRILDIPLTRVLFILLFTDMASTILSVNPALSLKKYVAFVMLPFIYYVVIIRSLKEEEDVHAILKAVAAGMGVLGVLGVLERYTGFNMVVYLNREMVAYIDELGGRVVATYPHPILFGTGLAMGIPINLVLIERSRESWRKLFYWLVICFSLAAIYFTFSRGAWLSTALSLIAGILLFRSKMRWRIILVILAMGVALLARPGVVNSIDGLRRLTFEYDTGKGSSYAYRWELWQVASREIQKSAERLALGYGDSSHEELNLRASLSYGDEREVYFWSWDNEYAAILLERGIIGLVVMLTMLFLIMRRLYKSYFSCSHKQLIVTISISTCVVIFMMTFVKMFSPQVYYLFWTQIALAFFLIDRSRENRGSTYGIAGVA